MKLKIILFNLSIIIFLICLIYLYIYVNYKYEGFDDIKVGPNGEKGPQYGDPGEVFRPEGARTNPITEKTTDSNALNETDAITKIKPTLFELDKDGATPETAISSRVIPYINVARASNNKPLLNDGYYWIDIPVPGVGKRYIYCIMDRSYYGGGWMLAMRAVRGSTTFGYNSHHWTTASTLNNTEAQIKNASAGADVSRSSIGNAIFNNYEGNQGAIDRFDAKFDTFNNYPANEWMAVFYFRNWAGIEYKGGDTLSGGGLDSSRAKGWIWRETNLYLDNAVRTPLEIFQIRSSGRYQRHNSMIDLRGNYGVANAKQLAKFGTRPPGMPQLWSSQHGYNFYGINYDAWEFAESWGGWWRRGSSTRWGFAWNENWNYATDNYSNDVYNGIGLRYPGGGRPGYSAGDFIWCCQDGVGVNTSIAFEWYVR